MVQSQIRLPQSKLSITRRPIARPAGLTDGSGIRGLFVPADRRQRAGTLARVQKKRPQLGGQAEAALGLCRGAERHDSDVGSQSAAAINFCVKAARPLSPVTA
jgi:hypothetical protein